MKGKTPLWKKCLQKLFAMCVMLSAGHISLMVSAPQRGCQPTSTARPPPPTDLRRALLPAADGRITIPRATTA